MGRAGGGPPALSAGLLWCMVVVVVGQAQPPFVFPPFLLPVAPDSTPTILPPLPPLDPPTKTRTLPASGSPPPWGGKTGPRIMEAYVTGLTSSSRTACDDFQVLNPPRGMRQASSVWPDVSVPSGMAGMLDGTAWAAQSRDQDQWYQIDAGRVRTIAGAVMQGGDRGGLASWVTSLKMMHSKDSIWWFEFDHGAVYTGNIDTSSKVGIRAQTVALARYLRILPMSSENWITLRAGLLLCTGRMASDATMIVSFDQPTNLGLAAVTSPTTSIPSPYLVLQLLEIHGEGQTLGRPDGFTGRWVDSRTFEVALNEKFNGRIDVDHATISIRNDSGLASSDGVYPAMTGSGTAVVLTYAISSAPGSVTWGRALTPADWLRSPGSMHNGEDGSDESNFAYLMAALVLSVVAMCGAVAYGAIRHFGRYQEQERHRQWIEEGKALANRRYPGGVVAAEKEAIEELRLHDPPEGNGDVELSPLVLSRSRGPGTGKASTRYTEWGSRRDDAHSNPITAVFPTPVGSRTASMHHGQGNV